MLRSGLIVAAAAPLVCACSANVKISDGAGTDEPVHTGSISKPRASDGNGLPPASDLAYAKRAAAQVMSRASADDSVTWENPASGARGTVTPIAQAYRVEGTLCRDFIASHVLEGSESWMEGEACRAARGEWEVRRLKAWRRT
ncbi:RT0821/Lpp0805 family surface protein [Pseudorhodoplanes sp.]|jgi:surface antigen|uniref:RT0821/Lpp0805 family surface protein n=1 Tax=Pseudorhodoplanes sp. TaxID=1934341 RepID=UPI002BEE94A8|nr:RT0821/Lpp0805 family surface protein [Pseudorhodoplanes sp.]HWV40793.1 RT0821/Lpp0805 family surface protein [Pseudorhodoplanes sp.]